MNLTDLTTIVDKEDKDKVRRRELIDRQNGRAGKGVGYGVPRILI
jgi:hypothetical protein